MNPRKCYYMLTVKNSHHDKITLKEVELNNSNNKKLPNIYGQKLKYRCLYEIYV